MRPVDLRNENWADLMELVTAERLHVHSLLCQCGPCTCRRLAEIYGLDVLSVAPRVTELYQLGFVELVGREGRRGIYRALSIETAQENFKKAREHRPEQMLMGMTA